MNKIIDSGFIRIYNKMIDDDSEYRVTPNELYVYSILFINRRQDESILTNIRIIESTMSDKALISNRPATNRQKIKEALIGLVNKNVLIMTCDIQIKEIATDTVFTMQINDQQLSKNPDSHNFNGYEELLIENYAMMLSPYDLMIYVNAQRFSKNGGFKGSYDRWAKLLDVSRNTAVKLLQKAEKRSPEQGGIITVVKGDYVAKNRQEINSYFSIDFSQFETEQEEEESIEPEQEPKQDKKVVFAFGDKAKKQKSKIRDEIPF